MLFSGWATSGTLALFLREKRNQHSQMIKIGLMENARPIHKPRTQVTAGADFASWAGRMHVCKISLWLLTSFIHFWEGGKPLEVETWISFFSFSLESQYCKVSSPLGWLSCRATEHPSRTSQVPPRHPGGTPWALLLGCIPEQAAFDSAAQPELTSLTWLFSRRINHTQPVESEARGTESCRNEGWKCCEWEEQGGVK